MFGLDRYDHIDSRLSGSGGVVSSEQEAMDILADIGRRVWTNDGETVTVHSIIYNLSAGKVYWAANENYSDPGAWFCFDVSAK